MTEQAERIRSAVEKNPRKMTLQLARDLGVPEVEVIRAFPSDRVIRLGPNDRRSSAPRFCVNPFAQQFREKLLPPQTGHETAPFELTVRPISMNGRIAVLLKARSENPLRR